MNSKAPRKRYADTNGNKGDKASSNAAILSRLQKARWEENDGYYSVIISADSVERYQKFFEYMGERLRADGNEFDNTEATVSRISKVFQSGSTEEGLVNLAEIRLSENDMKALGINTRQRNRGE
jgi:hypothetical protein